AFAQEAAGDWATVASGDPADAFASGAASQVIQSTGSLGGILDTADFAVGTAFLPGGPEGEGETPTGGARLMLAPEAAEETQLAAGMSVDHMTSGEGRVKVTEATG